MDIKARQHNPSTQPHFNVVQHTVKLGLWPYEFSGLSCRAQGSKRHVACLEITSHQRPSSWEPSALEVGVGRTTLRGTQGEDIMFAQHPGTRVKAAACAQFLCPIISIALDAPVIDRRQSCVQK